MYNVDPTKVTIYGATIGTYSFVGQGSHTINEIFFLGTLNSDTTTPKPTHLFCREIDASTGAAFDVDLGV